MKRSPGCAEPPLKRHKIARDEDDYLPGNITEIELHNFMTYDYLFFKPGSRLNLVIGPNGSGKSSIVCAIALGLGGEPQLLGRATSVGAYVKRGEESGRLKITLRGNNKSEKLCIARKIDASNKSEWLLNGKAVAKKDVLDIIQRFNIQVNNLTQFLPQDRVCEFAKLTPVQLLEETEMAVGDPELPIKHRALVEKSHELKNLELGIVRNGETLDQLRALNTELEKDVERVRQRDGLLSKVELMKKKLPWLKYDLQKMRYMEVREKEKEAKKKLDVAVKILKDSKDPIDTKKQEKASLDTQCRQISGLVKEDSRHREALREKEHRLSVQVSGKRKEMEDLRKQDESRQQRILEAKKDLEMAEAELKNLPAFEPPKDVLERLGAQISELGVLTNQRRIQRSEKEKIMTQKKTALRQCLDRLKDMENTNNKLLQALKNSGADRIFDAYSWLQQHRHKLKKEVYGPVLLEVNVSDRLHANYLEGHVPYYIWKSFITQDPGDRDFLFNNLKHFDVPIINFSGNEPRHRESFHLSKEMHQFGIYSRLDQVFEAPDAVKEVLITQFGLESSYVGSKETDEKADRVSGMKILDFWTPENHYRWTVSRYGGHVSGIVEPVGNSRLLLCGLDVKEIERLRSKRAELEESVASLEESIRAIVAEQRQLENDEAGLHREREEIINTVQLEKRRRREMENRIHQKIRRIECLEKEQDLDAVMAKCVVEAASLNASRYECAMEMKTVLVRAVSRAWSLAEKQMGCIELDSKIREMEVGLKSHEKRAEQAALQLEYCKKEVEEKRAQLASAKKHAESIAIITEELAGAFLEMPGTVEELEAAIQDGIHQANSMMFLNQNVLEEYEHRKKKIEAITGKLEVDKCAVKRHLDEINKLKEYWLPKLRSLVDQINGTFSHNFREMAIAGEVSLDEHEKDFDLFGILIRVKFREEGQLQVLSSHHQSGGERSVSTILYLVSLQDLANCPFRVVDEINQGMDPINERKMFQQLVRAASQPNTPQSFLLTPKLLPDLEYSNECTILNIMNGPWIEQPAKLWSSGGSWRTVSRVNSC